MGTEKEREVRQGHLAELSDILLRTFWSEPSSPVTQAGSLVSPGSRPPRGGQMQTTSILVCPETLAPPHEHQDRKGQGQREEERFALRKTLRILFN